VRRCKLPITRKKKNVVDNTFKKEKKRTKRKRKGERKVSQ